MGITFGKADYYFNLFGIPAFTFLIKSTLFFALNGSMPNIKRYMQTPTEKISL